MTLMKIFISSVIAVFFSLSSLAFPVSIPKDDLFFSKANNKMELNPNSISIFSWNIYKGNNSGFKKDFAKFASTEGIFLFQEYYDSKDVDSSLAKLKNKNILLGISYQISLWGKTGLGIVSSVNPSKVALLRTKKREDFSLATYKASLFSLYKIKNSPKNLLVVNVHLLNSVSVEDYSYELSRIRDSVLKHHGPLVIAGDFNNWSDRQTTLDIWAASLSLSKVKFSPDHRTNFDGNTINHIYFRDLSLLGTWSQAVSSSDHNPLGAKFSLTPQK